MPQDEPLKALLKDCVVLDTGTPIVYIGLLTTVTESVFVLTDADMHDCRDGHANQEVYLAETRREGVTANRHEVIVMRSAVISVSRLSDVIGE
jgi:hypothetical protein